MANYYGNGRSNYAAFKNVERFKTLCAEFDVEIIESKGKFGFYTKSESGEIDFLGDEEDERDLFAELLPLLEDDEVFIFIHAGWEKMRYITGYSIAGNNKGEKRQIDIYKIYELALQLTNAPEKIEAAEY